MIVPDYREFKHSNEIYHYGMPRRSGRYPWGSGDRPFQSIPKRIGKSVKDVYNKIPAPIKKVAKVGAGVGVGILATQALGVVGGRIVSAIAPPVFTDAIDLIRDFSSPGSRLSIEEMSDRVSEYVQEYPEIVDEASKYVRDNPQFVEMVTAYAKDNPQVLEEVSDFIQKNPQVLEAASKYIEDSPKDLSEITYSDLTTSITNGEIGDILLDKK